MEYAFDNKVIQVNPTKEELKIILRSKSLSTSTRIKDGKKSVNRFSKGLVKVFKFPTVKSKLCKSGQFVKGKFKNTGNFLKNSLYKKGIRGTLKYSKKKFKELNAQKIKLLIKNTLLFPVNNLAVLTVRRTWLWGNAKLLRGNVWVRKHLLLGFGVKKRMKKLNKTDKKRDILREKHNKKIEGWKNLAAGIRELSDTIKAQGEEQTSEKSKVREKGDMAA